MKVGLTGFPGAGKTTVFTALTGLRPDPSDRRPQLGAIKVPDARVDALAAIHRPKKVTFAETTFIDFPPARDAGAARKAVLDNETVTALRDAEALVEVVRGFPDLAGKAARPAEDIQAFDTELVLADLAVIEKRLDRLTREKGQEREKALLEKLQASLGEERPLRTLDLSADDRTALAGFAFLSLRPLLIALNVPEGDVAHPLPADVQAAATRAGAQAMVLSAPVEADVAELEVAERAAFLADLGLTESARDRFIRASYALLDLISFLTAGDDECRAWTIKRGTPARKAAGRIHSDIERGFIRAEVVAFDDFMQHGSDAKCREAGKFRLEGKEYVVKDGDIVHFRFAV